MLNLLKYQLQAAYKFYMRPARYVKKQYYVCPPPDSSTWTTIYRWYQKYIRVSY